MSSTQTEKPLNLTEAAVAFLSSLSAGKREAVTPAVMNFVRWYGGGHDISRLSPPKLAEYAEGQSAGAEGASKVKAAREFLAYVAKSSWTEVNLGGHMKAKKSPIRASASSVRPAIERLALTPEKKIEMESETATLKERRVHVIEDIKRAAADKDLKENAPYHAAREEKARLDGKIKELETLLKHAVIGQNVQHCIAGATAELGRKVTIRDVKSGATSVYILVTSREVNPRSGRISPVSPIGKAVMGRMAGETIEVSAPAGLILYTIECIE